jgi:hypothetical protein
MVSAIVFLTGRQDRIPLRSIPYRERLFYADGSVTGWNALITNMLGMGYVLAIYQDSHRGWEFVEFCTFDDRGRSHRRKSAAWQLTDMVWLYRLPIAAGRRGCFTPSNEFYLLSRRLGGEGVGTLWKMLLLIWSVPKVSTVMWSSE